MRLNSLGDFATFRGREFFQSRKKTSPNRPEVAAPHVFPTRQLSLATKNTSWKWPPIPAAESRRFWGKFSFFDLLKDGNPWELCHWELVAATGLNRRQKPQSPTSWMTDVATGVLRCGQRKTGLDCLKTQNWNWYHVGWLPLCGRHDEVPNNRIYRMGFFQNDPHSMNSKHLKNKSRVTPDKSTSFPPLPTVPRLLRCP